jgi:hypothetical protein
MTEEVILDTDVAAAKPHTVHGWLSRDGRFYSEESMARYSGCTHRKCRDCDQPAPKSWLVCDACRLKSDIARFEALPKKKWDGTGMVYSEAWDKYFSDLDDAEDEALDEGVELNALRLVHCKPNHVWRLDADYCCDQIAPDDEGEIPDAVQQAMDAFNKAVEGIVLSWSPDKIAVDLSEEAA